LVRPGLLDPLESRDQQEEEECQDLMVPGVRKEAPVTGAGWEGQDQKEILEMLANLVHLVCRV